MTISRRNLLWMVPLGLLLSAPIWQQRAAAFLKPRGGYDAAAERAYSQNDQNFVMEDVVLFFSSRGERTWTVNAKQARTGRTDREIDMIDVDASYSKKGDDPLVVTSRSGRYHMDDKHLILVDDVVLVKPVRHEEMHTELLHYYDRTKMLISPSNVQINGPNLDLKAEKMEYNTSTKAYEFNGRVRVVM